ncbi:hypothetical protein [Nonomuraea dietziae]|uniref:hypothetical protein n=1 Tax=Nonomuraea dietziae TaxID=65515 RepID=UPI0031E27275
MPALDMLLAGLARERSTGALRVGRSGTIFLDAGRVAYMECADTPGAEDVLAASGRVSEQTLGAARREGAGSRLVEEGALTRGELQHCVLGAVLDAAFFLLQVTGSRPKFRPARAALAGRPVVLRGRGDRPRVRPQGRAADGDLALGRAGHRPGLAGQAAARAPGGAQRPAVGDPHPRRQEATPPRTGQTAGQTGLLDAARGAQAGGRGTAAPSRGHGAAPARRPPGPRAQASARPRRSRAASRPAVNGDPTDLNLLIRLKKALEELS